MPMRNLLPLLPVLLLMSCAADKQAATSAAPERQSMNQRFRGKTIRPNAKGEWPDEVRKEYALDSGRESAYFSGESKIPKVYKTGEYAKTSWWGKSEVPRQPYTGNSGEATGYKTTARDQGRGARESNAAATVPDPYQTGDYQTGKAHETGVKRLDHPSDAVTDERRRSFEEPEVMSWKQRRALDMKATKSILGRD